MISKPSVTFYTLGCRLNQSETALLENALAAQGYRVLPSGEQANIAVINTCTVTENGDADMLKLVRKVNRANPGARIALIGCQSQLQSERLADLPNVRWVVGNAAKMDLGDILRSDEAGAARIVAPAIPGQNFRISYSGADRAHTRANLKIQEGCDFFCSYCAVPYARGRARSREFADVTRAARELVAAGHKEIVLTGVNLGVYADSGKILPDVIDAVAAVPGLLRVRLSSLEPLLFADELWGRMLPQGKLCRSVHTPLQSGSDRVLNLMNRKYRAEEFAGWITAAVKAVEGLCVGTDVIVGFPGETAADFDQTYALLESLPASYFHVFRYSAREQAASRKLSGRVAEPEIQRRSRALRDLSLKKRRAYFKGQAGRIETVLFEERKDGCWTGLTDRYVRVTVRTEKNLANQARRVELTKICGQKMLGELREKG